MQAESGGFAGMVRDYWPVLLFLGGVMLAALTQRLTGYFVTRREFTGVAAQKDLNGLGERVERIEKIREGDQTMLAQFNTRIDANARDIEQVKEYGSNVARALAERTDRRLNKIETLLARIDERMAAWQKQQERD